MDNGIVPIGKYKGQPLERLMADQPYSEWLLAQSWFIDRYAELAQLLRRGRLTEPQDTPEHNAMVARLIDRFDAFRWLAKVLKSDLTEFDIATLKFSQEIEPRGGDMLLHVELPTLYDRWQVMIEVKPLIGDDYPSVIRQIKAVEAKRRVVIAHTVQASNLSLEQVRRQFQLAGVYLILERDFLDDLEGRNAQYRAFAQKRREDGADETAKLHAQIALLEGQIEALRPQVNGDNWNCPVKAKIDTLNSEASKARLAIREIERELDLLTASGALQA